MPKVRTTLNLDQDVVERFQAVAELEGASLSAVCNSWLRQVVEPAEAMASVIDSDRQATMARLRHLTTAVQAATEIYAEAAQLARAAHPPAQSERPGAAAGRAREVQRAPGGRPAADSPRPVIRGGNSPKRGGKAHG